MQYRRWQDADAAANRKLEDFAKGIAANMDEKAELDRLAEELGKH